MKIKQDHLEFKPITITIETIEEARAFADIIEYTDCGNTYSKKMALAISNALTSCAVEIPADRSREYSIKITL